ncbi:hypothetical protein [Lysobacter sp. HA35]
MFQRTARKVLLGGLLVLAISAAAYAQNWRSPSGWPRDADMLSGELFPLSTYFGVCRIGPGVLRANISNGMRGHFATMATVVDDGELSVEIGKFSFVAGSTLVDLPASPGRRIRLLTEHGEESLLVTGLQRSSDTMSVISYKQNDREEYRAALRLANKLVACGLSRRL